MQKQKPKKKKRSLFKEFRDFAVKGDAISLAIGVIIGAAFKDVTNSLVNDLIMPPIGYLTAKIDFANMFSVLGGGSYKTIAEAEEAGAVIFKYGNFLNNFLVFLVTAWVVFFFVYKFQQLLRKTETKKKIEKPMKKCPYCFEEIKEKATRCPKCTSELEN